MFGLSLFSRDRTYAPAQPDPARGQKLPDAGDVVMVYPPSGNGSPHRPGVKPEPAVVLRVEWRETKPGAERLMFVRVARTAALSRRATAARPGSFDITGRANRTAAGLGEDRRVDVADLLTIPYKAPYIAIERGGEPILGKLSETDFDQFRRAYGALERERRREPSRRPAFDKTPARGAQRPIRTPQSRAAPVAAARPVARGGTER